MSLGLASVDASIALLLLLQKLLNAGALKAERLERFKALLALIEENKRINHPRLLSDFFLFAQK